MPAAGAVAELPEDWIVIGFAEAEDPTGAGAAMVIWGIGPIGTEVDDGATSGDAEAPASTAEATLLGTIKTPSATMFPLAPTALIATVIFPFVTVKVPNFAQSTPPYEPSTGATCWFSWT